jgi:23S rRNA (cytidine1920-2'-O)/16S rRNA (cytidine1409-2'-O)-methyltransferase
LKSGKKRKRLDVLIVERGLAPSRQRAQVLILEGKVLVNGVPSDKPGTQIDENAEITLRGEGIPYVSRGGLKLKEAALHFKVDFHEKTAMDVGVSTGGFTDYMLQNGAKKVYAIDVGYGQVDPKIRGDKRVVLLERTNIRHLDKGKFPEEADFVTIDVSFISLKLVLPLIVPFLKEGGEVLALVKPQFEVGRGDVDKGGVVKDEAKRLRAVRGVIEAAKEAGFTHLGTFQSPVPGQKKGNIEYFIYLRKD